MSSRVPQRSAVGSGETGLSLVEVAVIVLIMGAIFALALPAISRSISAYNLRSTADHMAQRLSAGRSLAMAKNRAIAVSINRETGLFGFDFSTPEADGIPDTTDPNDPAVEYYVGTVPDGMSISFDDDKAFTTVTFNSRGELPIGEQQRSITLANSSAQAVVQVDLRGKVTVTMGHK
jgi:Tfp pilus assembly protein FimT